VSSGASESARQARALKDAPPTSPKRGSFRPRVGTLRLLAVESQRSRLPQMAAALSYRTIFGLLPMIVVSLVVLKAFQSDSDIEHMLNKALVYAGLSTQETDESAFFKEPTDQQQEEAAVPKLHPEAGDWERLAAGWELAGHRGTSLKPPESIPTPPPDALANKDPDAPGSSAAPDSPSGGGEAPPQGSIGDAVKMLVARARTVDFRAIGLIGGITLIYAAISMLVEIERAFNQIYRVPVGKSWIRRIFQYWTILTLGSLLLFASFYVGEQFKQIVEDLASANGLKGDSAVWLLISGYGIAVMVSTVLMLLVYLAVPNTRVRLIPALAGALVAAILWEAGKWGFTQYLRYSTSYAKLYGSIALIPLFLLWVYLTWFIVLLGLQISYYLQQARAGGSLSLPGGQTVGWSDEQVGMVDPAAVLGVMEVVTLGFRDGRPTTLRRLTQQLGLARATVELLTDRLTERGFLHKLAGNSDEEQGFSLAQSPENIAAADVLQVGYDLAETRSTGDGESVRRTPGTLIESLRRAQIDAAGGATLASLIPPGGPRTPPGQGPSRDPLPGRPSAALPEVIDLESIPRRVDEVAPEPKSSAEAVWGETEPEGEANSSAGPTGSA